MALAVAAFKTTLHETDMAVKPNPEGYHSVTPYLSLTGAGKAIDL